MNNTEPHARDLQADLFEFNKMILREDIPHNTQTVWLRTAIPQAIERAINAEAELGVLKVNMEKLILVNQKLLMDISDLRNGMAERRKPNYNEDTRKILSENLKRLLSELWNEK